MLARPRQALALSLAALATATCEGGATPGAGGEPMLELGSADLETGSVFTSLAEGGVLPYPAGGQFALFVTLGLRARNMDRDLSGLIRIGDPATGAAIEEPFQRLLLYCPGGPWCEQLPLYVPLSPLGTATSLDGRSVTITAEFRDKADRRAAVSAVVTLRAIGLRDAGADADAGTDAGSGDAGNAGDARASVDAADDAAAADANQARD